MKMHLIVEGESDRQLFLAQKYWFDSLGLEVDVYPTNGKTNMEKNAHKYYEISLITNAQKIIFLPDQDADRCALVTRAKVGLESEERALTVVVKREIEAWILADGRCIEEATGLCYQPAGITDLEVDPKQTLYSLLKRKIGHLPTGAEAIALLKSHFSIERAAGNNNSARRFKEMIIRLTRREN